jgi:hypothetical protein
MTGRRLLLTLFVEVAVSVKNAATIQAVFEECCEATGDTLIGHRQYDDVGEVLLVVLLAQETHVNKHVPVLIQALQQRIILSYQFERMQLIAIRCCTSDHIHDIMQGFPLHSNESWFPALADPSLVYLCIRGPAMHPGQAHRLNEQEMDYHYL